MEAILDQVRHLAKGANEADRKLLLDSLKSLQHEIETPYDALVRFAGSVGPPGPYTLLASISVSF
jgi:demethylsterigmatocystin 6-O-methyltransferase